MHAVYTLYFDKLLFGMGKNRGTNNSIGEHSAFSTQKKSNKLTYEEAANLVEIDTAKQIIYVADTSNTEVFGEKCGINCSELIVPNNIIYADYDTSEVSDIKFSDLQIGDAVIVNAYESQLKGVSEGIINVEQIQLATQRLGND